MIVPRRLFDWEFRVMTMINAGRIHANPPRPALTIINQTSVTLATDEPLLNEFRGAQVRPSVYLNGLPEKYI